MQRGPPLRAATMKNATPIHPVARPLSKAAHHQKNESPVVHPDSWPPWGKWRPPTVYVSLDDRESPSMSPGENVDPWPPWGKWRPLHVDVSLDNGESHVLSPGECVPTLLRCQALHCIHRTDKEDCHWSWPWSVQNHVETIKENKLKQVNDT